MSLDIELVSKTLVTKKSTGVWVRDNGQTRELSAKEVSEKFGIPCEEKESTTDVVWSGNITGNLIPMADAVRYHPSFNPDYRISLYGTVWSPKTELQFREDLPLYGKDISPYLEELIIPLVRDKERLETFNPENGWGDYEGLLKFTIDYYRACIKYPNSKIVLL